MKPAVALAAVITAVVPAVGVADVLHSSATAPGLQRSPASAPLVGARLVCPDVVERSVGRISRIARLGVAAPGAPTQPKLGGRVVVRTLASTGTPPPQLTAPGTAHISRGPAYQSDVVIDGTAGLAPGLSGDELGRRDGGPYRGIDAVACTAPVDSAWLIGASTVVGAHAELRLTNTDDAVALVDLTVFSPGGVVNTRGGTGLAVAPHSTRIIGLETLAPAQALLMLHVKASSGRLAVALRQQFQAAATPQGQDWVPLAAAPATTAVVPGLFAGRGPRRLLLGNPGDTDATASIRLVRPDSAFVPRGLAAVTVPAGGTASVDLTTALGGRPGAVVVTGDHPLVAGALMSTGPRVNGFADVAFSAATPPLRGPAAAVVDYTPTPSTQLVLSAPQTAGAVQVTTLAGVGLPAAASVTVRIPAGRTVVYDVLALAHGRPVVPVSVTPVPGSGDVYAARSVVEVAARSPLIAVVPLVSAPQQAVVPAVMLDPRVGLPR